MTRKSMESYEQFHYLLRPGKQTERKLLVEIINILRGFDLKIENYRYVGLGSIYYVDFILFHKLLHISDMVCFEYTDIPIRMKFNKPFDFINLRMEPFSNYLQDIDSSKEYLVWLDDDKPLSGDTLDTMSLFSSQVKNGSVIILTVNCHIGSYVKGKSKNLSEFRKKLREELEDQFGKYAGAIEKRHLTKKFFPSLLVRIMRNKFEEALIDRKSDKIYPIINFKYADNAPMLTFGMIVDHQNRQVKYKELYNTNFVNQNVEPIEISVPYLTKREKYFVDKHMNKFSSNNTLVQKLKNEIGEEFIKDYIQYYKQYPIYNEVIM